MEIATGDCTYHIGLYSSRKLVEFSFTQLLPIQSLSHIGLFGDHLGCSMGSSCPPLSLLGAQIHVHWSVALSSHLILYCHLFLSPLNLSQLPEVGSFHAHCTGVRIHDCNVWTQMELSCKLLSRFLSLLGAISSSEIAELLALLLRLSPSCPF